MNTQTIGCSDRTFESHKLAFHFLIAILMAACTAQASTPPSFGDVEELTFQSGKFKVVGGLRLTAVLAIISVILGLIIIT